MRIAVVPGLSGGGLLCEIGADAAPRADPVTVNDLSRAIAEYEQSGGAGLRWVWASTAHVYPALLRAGVRVARCHDLSLAAGLVASRDVARPVRPSRASGAGPPGRLAERAGSADLTVAGARASPPDDDRLDLDSEELARSGLERAWPDRPGWPFGEPGSPDLAGTGLGQGALFELGQRAPPDPRLQLEALLAAHAGQLQAIAADERPGRFGALVAAESAGGLVAAEMTYAGLPWRPDVHDEVLTGLVGRRPPAHPPGTRPPRLAELAAQIALAFSGRPVNPDSPVQLLKAFAADGVRLTTTRTAVLRGVDHPAAPLLLEYKELSRLYSAFGWSWLDTWVSGGRFKPEYLVGGVVSGRWASRGGGALQIPRVMRRAVIADPGWVLVVADAAQLEPRVLAALAGDRAFASAAASGDLYEALASAFGGERAKAKIALLSAMYGGAAGEATQLLAILRRRFPDAAGYVEAAARAGEEGKVVRSVLGRTCPPPSAAWRSLTEESGDPETERDPGAARAARSRGRFTRNYVVQGSAADWALVLLAGLRSRLARLSPCGIPVPDGPPGSAEAASWGPHLVFFLHDEVIVHCPAELADDVVTAVTQAAEEAGRLVFGATEVRFPMATAVVSCYADAK